MKKKTRSRLSNSLLLPFLITIFICLIGASTNSWLFYKSFFRALTKQNEQPIATITFKYKTAQRKILDRVVWDRLRQESPVYNGDTIHTAALSEATIWFNDGNVMDLMENTMAQVFLTEDKGAAVELEDGYANVDSSDAENGMTLSSGGVQVAVKSGTSLSAGSVSQAGAAGAGAAGGKGSSGLSVQVLKGSASLQNADGSTLAIKQGEELNMSTGTAQVIPAKPALTVYAPVRNEKILYHTQGATDVHFSWSNTIASIVLQISKDKEFNDVLYRLNSDGLNETDIKLEAGTYFWKLDGSEEGVSEQQAINDGQIKSGKIQVIQSLPPTQVAPAENYTYSYRTRTPAVRIIWTESPYASTYKLEISKSQNMKNPIIEQRTSTTSSIISTLTEGTYYWRVTPYYTLNKKGFAEPSEVHIFKVERKGELTAPKLLVPSENGIVNTETTAKATSFSWKIENEAQSYTVRIADNPNLRNPAVSFETSDNFYTLNSNVTKLKDGKWYWGITMRDAEGNLSPVSEIRTFYTMKGVPEQHTVEPAEGYKCALTLLPDTKFTWKRNIPDNFVSELQISSDQGFKKIVYKAPVNSTSLRGVNLPLGTYYWRLRSKSTTDETELITPAKTLNVIGNLDEATLSAPGGRAIARETIPFKFKWSDVEGADYYKVSIFRQSDNKLVYENVVYEPEDNVDMFNPANFVDKANYRWRIQAFANEVPGVSSRRTGRLAESSFNLIKLRPVEITNPAKGTQYTGVDAILNPASAKWSSVDDVAKAQFVLLKADENDKVVLKVPTDEQMANGITVAPKSIKLDTEEGLRPGRYEIIVYAETLDGIDISNTDNKYKGRFTVLPVEPLDATTGLTTTPELLGAAYLRNPDNPRTIILSWAPVSKATDYIVEIKDKKNKVVLTQMVNKTRYEIDFMKLYETNKSTFAKGTFKWTVHAIRRIDTNKDGIVDKVLQEGPTAESTFSTDVPTPRKTKAKGARNPYGN
jgi:hypothetical protein